MSADKYILLHSVNGKILVVSEQSTDLQDRKTLIGRVDCLAEAYELIACKTGIKVETIDPVIYLEKLLEKHFK